MAPAGWIFITILLAGCTRAGVPVDFQTATPEAEEAPVPELELTRDFEDPDPADLAVIWVPEGERLPLRDSAGIAATSSIELAHDQQGLYPTGLTTSLGSSDWIEVEISSGEVGWVPDWNLTEQVPAEAFCSDPAIRIVLSHFVASLSQQQDQKLISLLSPKRNLIIRFGLSNDPVQIPEKRILGIFDDRRVYQWGTRFASQTNIEGSFQEAVLPSLLEVLQAEPEETCNEIQVGRNAPEAAWPGVYKNLNFISLYRPAVAGGNTFDWTTWVIAFEYIEGRPYIALLIQIRPQV